MQYYSTPHVPTIPGYSTFSSSPCYEPITTCLPAFTGFPSFVPSVIGGGKRVLLTREGYPPQLHITDAQTYEQFHAQLQGLLQTPIGSLVMQDQEFNVRVDLNDPVNFATMLKTDRPNILVLPPGASGPQPHSRSASLPASRPSHAPPPALLESNAPAPAPRPKASNSHGHAAPPPAHGHSDAPHAGHAIGHWGNVTKDHMRAAQGIIKHNDHMEWHEQMDHYGDMLEKYACLQDKYKHACDRYHSAERHYHDMKGGHGGGHGHGGDGHGHGDYGDADHHNRLDGGGDHYASYGRKPHSVRTHHVDVVPSHSMPPAMQQYPPVAYGY